MKIKKERKTGTYTIHSPQNYGSVSLAWSKWREVTHNCGFEGDSRLWDHCTTENRILVSPSSLSLKPSKLQLLFGPYRNGSCWLCATAASISELFSKRKVCKRNNHSTRCFRIHRCISSIQKFWLDFERLCSLVDCLFHNPCSLDRSYKLICSVWKDCIDFPSRYFRIGYFVLYQSMSMSGFWAWYRHGEDFGSLVSIKMHELFQSCKFNVRLT